MHVAAAGRRRAEVLRLELLAKAAGAAGPRPAAGTAEHAAQDILEAATAAGTAKAAAALRAAALEAVRAPGEAFEISLAAETAAAGMRALEAAEARLAFGVDLAAIERLALVVVAENFVSRIQLGEPRGSFRIGFVGVGMQFLGELAGRRS